MRKTKIICTLGPATDRGTVLEELVLTFVEAEKGFRFRTAQRGIMALRVWGESHFFLIEETCESQYLRNSSNVLYRFNCPYPHSGFGNTMLSGRVAPSMSRLFN